MTLTVKGHPVHVPKATLGAARFSFHDLCEQPLGAADYLRIAREFHTIVLDHVPVMRYETRNAAKRFIALIDTLYDNSVKLIASAQAQPHELYRAEEGYEASEFDRTASRLIEMGSQSYLSLPHGPRSAEAKSAPTPSSTPDRLVRLLRLRSQRYCTAKRSRRIARQGSWQSRT